MVRGLETLMARFIKPTVEEIKAYAVEVFPQLDVGRFYDHYEMVGWVVGKNKPMKNWQAAVRLWKRNYEEWTGIRAKQDEQPDWKSRYNAAQQPS